MGVIDQVLQQLNPVSNSSIYDRTPGLSQVRKFSRDTFGTPSYLNPSIPREQRDMELVQSFSPMGMATVAQRGAMKMSPQVIKRAAQLLGAGGRVNPQDTELIANFADATARGGKGNMGQMGQTVQSLLQNLFGEQGRTLQNKQASQALEQVLKRALEGK